MATEERFDEVQEQAGELFKYDVGDEFRIFSRLHDGEGAEWEEYRVVCRVLMLDYGELEYEYPDADETSKRLVYDLESHESDNVKTAPQVYIEESETVEYISD